MVQNENDRSIKEIRVLLKLDGLELNIAFNEYIGVYMAYVPTILRCVGLHPLKTKAANIAWRVYEDIRRNHSVATETEAANDAWRKYVKERMEEI